MFKKINFADRSKLVVLCMLLISSILVACIAFFALNKIQTKLFDSYSNFGQLLTKTLAVQSYEITKNLRDERKIVALDNYVEKILEGNHDISFVTFKDKSGNVLYTRENKDSEDATKINITSPILSQNGEILGTIETGLNAKMANSVQQTAKNSILIAFALSWLAFSLILIAHAILSTRELSFLHEGVAEIASGKFGTTIKYDKARHEVKELFHAFNKMSKKLHVYEEQNIDTLTLEKNKLEAVLMGIVNGVVVCDSEDKITLINDSAKNILNAKTDEILNTKMDLYTDIEGENSFAAPISKFKETPLAELENSPLVFNIQIAKKVVKTIISPLYSKMHDYLGYIIILIDITKEAEIDKLKSDFISNVSHELRTPVTVLRSYVDTLYSYGADFDIKEQQDFIGIINENVIRLNKMVNDVLDFSKMQSDTILEKKPCDLVEIVENSIKNLKILADEKSVEIKLKNEENLPLVPLNAETIERVMNNLITNAIKYSNENSKVEVNVKMAENDDMVEVTVKDNGCGIACEHLDKIFDRFYRIENAAHTIKGTGLGLHLTKVGIEKKHNGVVFVKSKVNEGSTFGFRLPLKLSVKEQDLQNFNSAKKVGV